VRNLTGTDDLPQKLVYRILAQAEGNPFYVEEILRALIDAGVLVRSTSEEPWQVVREVDGIAIPETILGVLTARIDRLQRDTRYVLQLASVVGRIFARPVLAALAESVDNLDHHLAILQQEELIRERPAVAEREYIFKHELTREATYNGILKRQRRVFHRRAAEALERLFPERRDDLLGLLAYHLENTEEPSRAIPYLLRTGDRARLAYAHQEAVDAYRRALSLQEAQRDDEGSARTLMRLGLVHTAAFDFGLASKAYEQSFALRSRKPAAGRPTEDLPAAPHALRQMWGLEPKDWDPNPTFDYEIPLFSGLLEESDELETVPDIATRWEIKDGGRTYVFHLRDDVCWSDGVPLTAADFEFAWKRLLDPRVPPMNARRRTLDPSTGLRSADLLHDVRGAQAYHQGETPDPSALGVCALDPLTLLVELEQPVVDFIHVMAHPVAYPVPRHCVERYGDAWCEAAVIVGNGPFVLKRWHARSRADLVRNPLYHGRFGGNLSEVELQCLPYPTDWLARLELYEADQIDILCLSNWPLAGLELARLRHPGDYRRFPCLNTMAFCFDVRRTPFDDRRVRCAFAHAFDRVAWVREAHGDHVGLATGGFVPPAMAGHSPHTSLGYDPALARNLLATAGYPGGSGFPDVEFLAMMTPTVRAGLAHWRQKIKDVLGISVRWSVVNWMEYFERLEHNPPHIGIMSWSANTPDPDDYLGAGYRHIQRYFGWQHDRYDRLVDAARQLADSDARLDLYRQADAILVNEAAIMPQMHNPSIFLVKPWIKSYPLSPLVGLSVWMCLKDIVLAPH
jgi:ABC-type oligopeptide transport system substrate-binding subunit